MSHHATKTTDVTKTKRSPTAYLYFGTSLLGFDLMLAILLILQPEKQSASEAIFESGVMGLVFWFGLAMTIVGIIRLARSPK